MRARTVKRLLVLAAIAAAGLLGRRWYAVHSRLPEPDELALELPEQWSSLSIAIIPAGDRDPTPAELLEQRLAALAESIDERRKQRGTAGLVDFDVEGLSSALATILAKIGDAAQISIHIRDLRTGHVLFDDFGDTPLNPASNQKLLTSAAALELLGPDYTFVTRVLRDDTTLFLVGEGDPQLSLLDLRALATETVAAIEPTSVQRLVVDDSAFSHRMLPPGYDQGGPGLAYEAESSALSLGYNTVQVSVVPAGPRRGPATVAPAGATKAGPDVVVTTVPATKAIAIVNRARIGPRRTIAVRTIDREGDTVVEVTGKMPRRGPPTIVARRIHDPARTTGTIFAEILAELSTSEPLAVVRGVAPAGAEEIARHESAILLEILDAELTWSNNFIAEQVLRTLAWRMTGEPGDWAAGQDILRGYWSALGNDPDEVVIENGSGLSRSGRLTTSGLVDLIAMAQRDAGGGPGLLDVLPVAGEEGTLRSRLRLSGKRVRAKTGTLHDVSGLTGVITGEDGTPQIAFSILINAHDVALDTAKRHVIEDGIVTATLAALDDYEARLAGIVPPKTTAARPRGPSRAAARADRPRP